MTEANGAGAAQMILLLYGTYLCEVLREHLNDDDRALQPLSEIANWVMDVKTG